MKKAAISAVFFFLAGLSACSGVPGSVRRAADAVNSAPADAPNAPAGPIGQKYYADGPWAVTAKAAFACCDSTGNAYDIWYPADLGKDGFKHPIITWGNGSDAVPSQYAYLLNHLATWGFIVVASGTTAAHTGEEMIDAARYIVQLNDDSQSPFYKKVAVDQIGAMGHSQGSGGALRALMNSGGFIKTAIPIERPAQMFCAPGDCPTTSGIAAGSVFFINGSADAIISPSTQTGGCVLDGETGEQSNACMYAHVPESVDKLWATLVGPDHNDVQGQPTCPSPNFCVNGVYGFLGYPTAWMMDRLQNDAEAHGAFVSGTGEIFTDSASWSNQISNIH